MFFVIEGKVEKLVFHNQERQKNHETGPTLGGSKLMQHVVGTFVYFCGIPTGVIIP